MPDFLADLPIALVFGFLFFGAMMRGQGIYWAGRIVTEQALRRTHPTGGRLKRVHDWLQGGGADAGIRAIRRWGLVAVPFSYLTVGFQSMVQAGAGVLRITWWKYLLAQVPGALAWATIYSTIGWAGWIALQEALTGNPLALAGILAVALVAVVTHVVLRRRRRADVVPDSVGDGDEIDTYSEVVQLETGEAPGPSPGGPEPAGR